MKVQKGKAEAIFQVLDDWVKHHKISQELATELKGTIEPVPFDWRRLARYCFIVAVISFLISITAVLSDQAILKLIELYLGTPAVVKASALMLLSAILFLWGYNRKKLKPNMVFRNEAVFTLGVLTFAGSLCYWAFFLKLEPEEFRFLTLIATLSYGALGLLLQSPLIWLFALLSLGGWLGAETGYISGWGAYYLGMNYPLRFVLFGGLLTAVSPLLKGHPKTEALYQTNLVMGLLYLFFALWLLSIFGNFGDPVAWFAVKQIELFHWSLLFALAAIGSFVHGLTYDNTTTRAFGLVFLFINLYTRFFEYFWNPLHKGIFFALLGISLWYLGTHAEKIWNFQPGKKDVP